MTTNYVNTFIAVSPDSTAPQGTEPKPGSVAALQFALLRERPYGYTSDELLFEVHAVRSGFSDADRSNDRDAFFAKARACLRASPLVKQHGWGLHHDAQSRVAAYDVHTDNYRRLAADAGLRQTQGMRNKRSR